MKQRKLTVEHFDRHLSSLLRWWQSKETTKSSTPKGFALEQEDGNRSTDTAQPSVNPRPRYLCPSYQTWRSQLFQASQNVEDGKLVEQTGGKSFHIQDTNVSLQDIERLLNDTQKKDCTCWRILVVRTIGSESNSMERMNEQTSERTNEGMNEWSNFL